MQELMQTAQTEQENGSVMTKMATWLKAGTFSMEIHITLT